MKKLLVTPLLLGILILLGLSSCKKEESVYENGLYYNYVFAKKDPSQGWIFIDDDSLTYASYQKLTLPDSLLNKRYYIEFQKVKPEYKYSGFDYTISIYYDHTMLTKSIEDLKTKEDSTKFGDDNMLLNHLQLTGKYINVNFTFLGFSQTHLISLVQDTYNKVEDTRPLVDRDTVYADLKHNAKGDYPTNTIYGVASFDISKVIAPERTKEVVLCVSYRASQNTVSKYFVKVDPAKVYKLEQAAGLTIVPNILNNKTEFNLDLIN